MKWFFTNMLSQITGLKTIDHVHEMKQMMIKVETGVLATAEAWKTGTAHFTAAIRLEKSRIDNVYQLLDLHKQSTESLQRLLMLIEQPVTGYVWYPE